MSNTPPPTSASDLFINPASSVKTRMRAILPQSQSMSSAPSASSIPSRTTKPSSYAHLAVDGDGAFAHALDDHPHSSALSFSRLERCVPERVGHMLFLEKFLGTSNQFRVFGSNVLRFTKVVVEVVNLNRRGSGLFAQRFPSGRFRRARQPARPALEEFPVQKLAL